MAVGCASPILSPIMGSVLLVARAARLSFQLFSLAARSAPRAVLEKCGDHCALE